MENGQPSPIKIKEVVPDPETLNKLAAADDRLEMIEKYFSTNWKYISHFALYKMCKMIYNSYNQ